MFLSTRAFDGGCRGCCAYTDRIRSCDRVVERTDACSDTNKKSHHDSRGVYLPRGALCFDDLAVGRAILFDLLAVACWYHENALSQSEQILFSAIEIQ